MKPKGTLTDEFNRVAQHQTAEPQKIRVFDDGGVDEIIQTRSPERIHLDPPSTLELQMHLRPGGALEQAVHTELDNEGRAAAAAQRAAMTPEQRLAEIQRRLTMQQRFNAAANSPTHQFNKAAKDQGDGRER